MQFPSVPRLFRQKRRAAYSISPNKATAPQCFAVIATITYISGGGMWSKNVARPFRPVQTESERRREDKDRAGNRPVRGHPGERGLNTIWPLALTAGHSQLALFRPLRRRARQLFPTRPESARCFTPRTKTPGQDDRSCACVDCGKQGAFVLAYGQLPSGPVVQTMAKRPSGCDTLRRTDATSCSLWWQTACDGRLWRTDASSAAAPRGGVVPRSRPVV